MKNTWINSVTQRNITAIKETIQLFLFYFKNILAGNFNYFFHNQFHLGHRGFGLTNTDQNFYKTKIDLKITKYSLWLTFKNMFHIKQGVHFGKMVDLFEQVFLAGDLTSRESKAI